MALLVRERDVFAGVWAAEERVAGNQDVGQEAEPDGIEGVVEVRSVTDSFNGDARALSALGDGLTVD